MVEESRPREWERMFPGLTMDAFKPCKKLKNAIMYDDGIAISTDGLVTLVENGIYEAANRHIIVFLSFKYMWRHLIFLLMLSLRRSLTCAGACAIVSTLSLRLC